MHPRTAILHRMRGMLSKNNV